MRHLSRHKRIMIFGKPGSGKSTFAIKISKKLQIPVYHLDKYFFVHNWIERNYQEFLVIQQNIVEKEEWIIDGNSIKSLEIRYVRADCIIYFNYSRVICYWRIFKRRFYKDSIVQDRADGCKEIIRWNLLIYLWCFENRIRKQLIYFEIKIPRCDIH